MEVTYKQIEKVGVVAASVMIEGAVVLVVVDVPLNTVVYFLYILMNARQVNVYTMKVTKYCLQQR